MFSARELDIYGKLVRLVSNPDWRGFEDFLALKTEKDFDEFLTSSDGELGKLQARAKSWLNILLAVGQFVREVEEEKKRSQK